MANLEDLWPILQLSIFVTSAAVLASSMIGIPLGVWLGLRDVAGKRLLLAAVHTGMALPPVVVGLGVYLLLSRSGPLGSLGWLFSPRAMILAQIILDLPFVVGITSAAVAAVPHELRWQLRAIGATQRQAAWSVVREARSGVLLAVASAFGRSLSEVGAVWLVGGNIEDRTRVLTTAIVLETNKGNVGLALLLGGVLLTIALVTNVAIVRYQWRVAS